MANIWELFSKIAYKHGVDTTSLDTETQKGFNAHATKLANDYKNIEKIDIEIDEINNKIVNLKASASKKTKKAYMAEMASLKKELSFKEAETKVIKEKKDKLDKLLTTRYHLSVDQLDQLHDLVQANSSSILDSSKKYHNSFYDLDKSISSGSDVIVSASKRILGEFGFWGEAMGLAFEQINKLNKKLIEFNRNMSLGFSNDVLGMDLYGTGSANSLSSLSTGNALTEDEFLKAFAGLNKGNVLNQDNKNLGTANDFQDFGIKTAQLSKFYGVEIDKLTSISGTLVYNYGMKLKDVNKVFKEGKEDAISAGVSVKKYFENLKEATDLLGNQYINGGVKGLQDLALYASKTDQSISSIMKTADQFKDYTSSFEKQNTAAALAMMNTASQTAKIWALEFQGRKQEADVVLKGSLVKDIIANGYTNKNNDLDQRGLSTLQDMGMDAEQIKSIQKLVRLQKEQGITVEQLNNKEKQSLAIKAKIQEFEYKNLTVSEKMSAMWGKLKGAIIDPIASLISPLFDLTLNVLGTVIDVITPFARILGVPIMMLGKAIGWLVDKFNFLLSGISAFFNGFNTGIDKVTDNLGLFSKAILAGIGAFMLFKNGGLIQSGKGLLQGAVSGFKGAGSYTNRIANIISSGKGGLLNPISMAKNAGKGLLISGKGLIGTVGKGLKSGLGIGALTAIGGNLLGGAVGGQGGKTVSTVANWAGTGAAIGGAVGALVGGVGGLIYASKDKLSKVWADDSKSFVGKLWGTMTALWDSLTEALKGIWDWAKNLFSDDDKEKFAANSLVQGQTADPYAAIKASAEIKKIIDYRETDNNSFKKEKEQAKEMQRVFAPEIHIKQSFDGTIKTRVQGR